MGDKSWDISRLIQRARLAEPGAVNRLLEVYRDYLGLFAQIWIDRSLPGKVDPSDLVQETLLKAHQKFGQFRGMTEPELAGWVRQILARNVADLVRRHQASARRMPREHTAKGMLNESVVAVDNLMAASGTSPSQAAERRELGVLLADALAELRADHREVIVLRNLEELDWDEVAERMGRSVGAVRMLWARALKELRPLIEARQ